MSDGRSPQNDPSMDDILASIRRIISDDEARAQVGDAANRPEIANADPISSVPSAPPVPPRRDDVLLLTDLIDEPPGAPIRKEAELIVMPAVAVESPVAPPPVEPVFVPPPPPVVEAVQSEPVKSVPPPAPVFDPLPNIVPERVPEMTNSSNPSDPLVGQSVVGATASAFDRLNQAMQESVPPPAATNPGPSLGAGGKTIEDMVQDMLRPMLKDWLDRNLPPIVERYVEREIVRLTRR